jgi:hypothetical protein
MVKSSWCVGVYEAGLSIKHSLFEPWSFGVLGVLIRRGRASVSRSSTQMQRHSLQEAGVVREDLEEIGIEHPE